MASETTGFFSRETETLLYLLGYQAQKDSCKVYAAGSFVRDMLLEKENRQLDLLVDGDVVSYARNLQYFLPGKIHYAEPLGTASLHLPGRFNIQMSTIKNEVYVLSEEPDSKTSLKNELYQRDFTINTLAMELNPRNFCKIYDYFGGKNDINEKTLRILYSLSFVNEPLRLLRALRLEQRYGFVINDETASLMLKAITGNVLQKVSRESIGRELRLIFYEPNPSRVLQRLQELGLWHQVFPRLPFDETILPRLQRLEKIFNRYQFENNRTYRYNNFIISICILFYGLSRHDIQYLTHVLRLKRKERLEVMELMETLTPAVQSQAANTEEDENRVVSFLVKQYAGEGR